MDRFGNNIPKNGLAARLSNRVLAKGMSLGDVLARLVKADPVDCLRVANGQDSTSCQEVYPKMLMQPPI